MKSPGYASLALLLALGGVTPSIGTATDPVTRALEDELARSLERLELGEQPRPYFIAYRVEDVRITDVAATFGGLVTSGESHGRFLSVEVRVGDPGLDNTNFFTFPTGPSGVARSFRGQLQVALTDDYRELRRQAWLLTDGAYKEALDRLARKKAALRNRQRSVDLPDFGAVEPQTLTLPVEAVVTAPSAAEDLVRDLSSIFRRFPTIQRSEVHLRSSFVETRYVNSEGSSFHYGQPLVRLSASAERQAADGRLLADALAYYGRTLEDLPGAVDVETAVEALGERLEDAGDGFLVERYNGPVLLEGPAAAELVLQALAPRLSGFRRPVAEDPRIEESLEQFSGGFNDKLGGRVLARFLRLVDDPSRERFDGRPLVGGYPIDGDAVLAGPTVLVERGILKTLLTTRNPSPGALASTGSRRGAGAAPSNLLFAADETMTPAELEAELLALVAERELDYGVVIRRIANPELVTGRRRDGPRGASGIGDEVGGIADAYRLYPDGRTEPLRNLEIVGLATSSFKDVVAASEDLTVYSAPLAAGDRLARLTGAFDVRPLAVSTVVPALLFEELTLKTPNDPVPNLPVVPHPFFDDTVAGEAARVGAER